MSAHHHQGRTGFIAVALGVALAAGGLIGVNSPAWADDGQAQADQTANAIAAAAPDTGVVAPQAVGDAFAATSAGTKVTLPDAATGVVTIAPAAPQAGTSAKPVTVSLPRGAANAPAKKAKNGTVVYPTANASAATAAAQVLADGSVRMSTVLNSAKSPQSFTYAIGGATPQLQPDGSVDLVQTTTGDGYTLVQTVGHIAPAWAKDAAGRPVATHYTVTGNQLVQVVSPDQGAKYPIVADPQIEKHWYGTYMYLNKTETNRFMFGANLSAVVGGAVALAGIPQAAALSVVGGLYASVAGLAQGGGGCLELYWPPLTNLPVPMTYYGGYCR